MNKIQENGIYTSNIYVEDKCISFTNERGIKMSTKKYAKPVMINMQLEAAKLATLKQIARQMSVERKSDIAYSDLIRLSIDNFLYDQSLVEKYRKQGEN